MIIYSDKKYWKGKDYIVEDIFGKQIVVGRIMDNNNDLPIKYVYAWAWDHNFQYQSLIFSSRNQGIIFTSMEAAKTRIEQEIADFLETSKQLCEI